MRIEQSYEQNRVKLPREFIFPSLRAECVGCVEIRGIRNIVWSLDGETFLQECLANKSVFYAVKV